MSRQAALTSQSLRSFEAALLYSLKEQQQYRHLLAVLQSCGHHHSHCIHTEFSMHTFQRFTELNNIQAHTLVTLVPYGTVDRFMQVNQGQQKTMLTHKIGSDDNINKHLYRLPTSIRLTWIIPEYMHYKPLHSERQTHNYFNYSNGTWMRHIRQNKISYYYHYYHHHSVKSSIVHPALVCNMLIVQDYSEKPFIRIRHCSLRFGY